MRLPEIPLQIAPEILKKYEIRIFLVFLWYFRGIFSIPCRRGNLYVGLVFLAYFGVCGVFCSVAGSWVVNPIFESFLSHFWVIELTWGGTPKVTFESLFGHFNSFWVSVELGGRPLHNFRNSVFEVSNLVSTKTLLLKHDYRRQGKRA